METDMPNSILSDGRGVEKAIAPITLDIDRSTKRLLVTIGSETVALDVVVASEFIDQLTQFHFALVRILEGYRTNLPIDPKLAFEPVIDGLCLAPYGDLSEAKVLKDEQRGLVSLLVMTTAGRLQETRMEPNEAKTLGGWLAGAADTIAGPATVC